MLDELGHVVISCLLPFAVNAILNLSILFSPYVASPGNFLACSRVSPLFSSIIQLRIVALILFS